jgi:hypothetical protein
MHHGGRILPEKRAVAALFLGDASVHGSGPRQGRRRRRQLGGRAQRRGKGRAMARRGGDTCGDDVQHRGGAASQGLRHGVRRRAGGAGGRRRSGGGARLLQGRHPWGAMALLVVCTGAGATGAQEVTQGGRGLRSGGGARAEERAMARRGRAWRWLQERHKRGGCCIGERRRGKGFVSRRARCDAARRREHEQEEMQL